MHWKHLDCLFGKRNSGLQSRCQSIPARNARRAGMDAGCQRLRTYSMDWKISDVLWPPNPKELVMAVLTLPRLGMWGV